MDAAERESTGETGPSTPCRGASPRPPGCLQTPPPQPSLVCSAQQFRPRGKPSLTWHQARRGPRDDSDFRQATEAQPDPDRSNRRQRNRVQGSGSHAEGSPPAPAGPTPRRVRVYSDLLPASSQPQTPQNLPEARHQSRLQGSYTAPPRRASPQPMTPTSSRARGASVRRRGVSPPGLQTPGFKGLYGGAENMDDEDLAWEMGQSRPATSRAGSSP